MGRVSSLKDKEKGTLSVYSCSGAYSFDWCYSVFSESTGFPEAAL